MADPDDRSHDRHPDAQPPGSTGATPPRQQPGADGSWPERSRRPQRTSPGNPGSGPEHETPAAATAKTPLQITCPRRGSGPAAVTAKTPKMGLETTAAVCVFSVTPCVTERDSGTGRGQAGKPHLAAPRRPGTRWRAPPRRSGGMTACRSLARWTIPGWHPSACPGSPRVPRHAAGGRPSRSRPRTPAAPGHPGRAPAHPCAVTRDQRYREGRRAPYGMHDGRGCQRHGNPGRPCWRQVRAVRSRNTGWPWRGR